MEPVVVRKTIAEKADINPKRIKRHKTARVRFPPVVVYTGLPPLVDGQIRCFVKLTIRRIRLVQHELNGNEDIRVRVKWWGEPSNGAYFKPICGRNQLGREITARYAVRCGPKQFAAYLMDAGSLTLELVSGASEKVFGTANVTDIVTLTAQRPIIDWYKVTAKNTHKHVADVHVNLSFCELQDIYGESSGTGTGTEKSQDESDDSSPVEVGRTYRIETGFKESPIRKPKVTFQDEVMKNDGSLTQPHSMNPASSAISTEVDRLIERAELLKMLISPDPLRSDLQPQPKTSCDVDEDISLSDASLIADLFYGKSNARIYHGPTIDSSVQVSPDRTPKVTTPTKVLSPDVSPLKMAIKSPRPIARRVTSPKVVKFADIDDRRSVPAELVALLKRVKGATITVNAIRLSPGDYHHFIAGSIPRRQIGSALSLSKPPRPLKVTFFVRAQLPTGEMCQLMRICGKADMETNIIDFNQSENISLNFTNSRIALWLESAAITFHVSCRHASVNRTQPLGVSVYSLEHLLLSENFKSRQHVALSTRNPGSTLEMSVELHVASLLEAETNGDNSTPLDRSFDDSGKQPLNEPVVSPQSKPEPKPASGTPVASEVSQTPPLVLMFCINEVEFCNSFVDRMASATSVAQRVADHDAVSNRWQVYLTTAAFSQPRRSSSKRTVLLAGKATDNMPAISFSPKLQIFYVYNLETSTTSRFEDNNLIVELRRHIPQSNNGDDQLLAICKVSLHQLYLAYGCDPVATSAVLRSPGPVVTVNNEFLPADDPFTLAQVARLCCTMAVGTADQIAHFNALVANRDLMASPSLNILDQSRNDSKKSKSDHQPPNVSRLSMMITEIDQLVVPIDVDSEADVFVAYQFPTTFGLRGELAASRPEVKSFKTPMRPYQGSENAVNFGNDASFSHDFSTAIDSTTLLADLVRSFSFLTCHSSTMGVDFLVSIRLYKPVVRDVTVGYATLSLTRLASLITSTKSIKQRVFVRLPITPIDQHHPIGWLTVKLSFTLPTGAVDSSPKRGQSHHRQCDIDKAIRINVKQACGLRTAAKRLGLRVSSSSSGFKAYCALRSSDESVMIAKSDCQVADRSFCPTFRLSQFDLAFKKSAPKDPIDIQLFARDRRQGDLLVGSVDVPSSIVDIVTKFRPRLSVTLSLPLTTDQPTKSTSDLYMDNAVGVVDVDCQVPPSKTWQQPAVPRWFQAEPRTKISLYLDKIVVALPAESTMTIDDVFKCRLSIGDSFSSPLSLSTSRPVSSTSPSKEDLIIIATSPESIVLEHAVPCPPVGQVVDYLARCHGKIEVNICGNTLFSSIPLVELLSKQTIPGQFPLISSPPCADYHGSCVFARLAVESLSSSGSSKDRLSGKSSLKTENDCFVASVGISRALHLPQHLLDREVYVVVGAYEPMRTHNVPACDRPIWNFAADTLIPKDLLSTPTNQGGLIFRLMTTSKRQTSAAVNDDDPVVAFCSVELTALSRGIGSVSGWYNLVDAFGHCLGQILLSITPVEEVYHPPPSKFAARLILAPEGRIENLDEQSEEEEEGEISEKQPTNNICEIPPPVVQQNTNAASGFDADQLESLSRRIACLLADPLPPRFPTETKTNEISTSTNDDFQPPPVAPEPVRKTPVADVGVGTDFNLVNSVNQMAQLAKSTSSASSSESDRNSSSSKKSGELTSSKLDPVQRSNRGGTPDSVEMLFEVEKMLASTDTSPRPPSSARMPFITKVDESIFTSNVCPAANLVSADVPFVRLDISTDFEGENDRYQRAMSPSVLEQSEQQEISKIGGDEKGKEKTGNCEINKQQQQQQGSASSSPPPLENMSQTSTEEWSHSCAADEQTQNTADETPRNIDEGVGCCGGGGDYVNTQNCSSVEQMIADWSTLLLHQFDSPHQSSSPVSARNSRKNDNNNDDLVAPYSPPSSTPRGDEDESPRCDDTVKTKQRRSHPAWLADANSKLSTALPSFFPRPDSLRMALERVRTQHSELSPSPTAADLNSSSQHNATLTRRPLPTFDVDEARRIAKIFSAT